MKAQKEPKATKSSGTVRLQTGVVELATHLIIPSAPFLLHALYFCNKQKRLPEREGITWGEPHSGPPGEFYFSLELLPQERKRGPQQGTDMVALLESRASKRLARLSL